MSRKDEFTAGTGKAIVPPSDKDIFAEQPTMPAVRRSTVPQDDPSIPTYDAGRPQPQGGTPVDLDSNGRGETVIPGTPEAPRRFEGPVTNNDPNKDVVPQRPTPEDQDPEFAEKFEAPATVVAPKKRGTKSQRSAGVIVGAPRPTRASKAADAAKPLTAPDGTPIERDEVSQEERNAARDAARDASPLITGGKRSGSGKDLVLGALSKADRTRAKKERSHRRSLRQRAKKGMGVQTPLQETAEAVNVENESAANAEFSKRQDESGVRRAEVTEALSTPVQDSVEVPAAPGKRKPTTTITGGGMTAEEATARAAALVPAATKPEVEQIQPVDAAFSDEHHFGQVAKHINAGIEDPNNHVSVADIQDWVARGTHTDANGNTVRNKDVFGNTRKTPGLAMYEMVGKHLASLKAGTGGHPAFHAMVQSILRHKNLDLGAERQDVIRSKRRSRALEGAPQAAADFEASGGAGITEKPKGTRSASPLPQRETEPSETAPLRDVAVGAKLSHDTHGVGTVVSVEGGHATVDFKEQHPVDRSPVYRRLPLHTTVTPL